MNDRLSMNDNNSTPEDQTRYTGGLVPVDNDDAARADAGPISPGNPVAVAGAFFSFLRVPGGLNIDHLALVVTPESLPAWGDFRSAAEQLADCGMATRANPDGDNDVVYVKFRNRDSDGRTRQVRGGDIMLNIREVPLWFVTS